MLCPPLPKDSKYSALRGRVNHHISTCYVPHRRKKDSLRSGLLRRDKINDSKIDKVKLYQKLNSQHQSQHAPSSLTVLRGKRWEMCLPQTGPTRQGPRAGAPADAPWAIHQESCQCLASDAFNLSRERGGRRGNGSRLGIRPSLLQPNFEGA